MKNKTYKKLASTLCLSVAIANSNIPYNVFRTPMQVMAAVQAEISDATTIDISKIPTIEGYRRYNITQSGKYILTGSNYVEEDPESGTGGTYIDTQITVEAGVTADLYLDSLELTNDDGNVEYIGSGGDAFIGVTSPLVIDGTANVHICDDSTIEALNSIVTVNGMMNIVESNKNELDEKAKVTFQLFEKELNDYDYIAFDVFSGNGTIHMTGGDVRIDSQSRNDNSKYISPTFIVSDGTLTWSGSGYKQIGHNRFDGGYIAIEGDFVSSKRNSAGDYLQERIFEGLPIGAQVLQMNQFTQNDVFIDENSILKTYLPENKENIIYIGEVAYTYEANSNTLKDTKTSHRLTFLDAQTDEVLASYLVREDYPVELLQSEKYDYSYMLGNSPVTAETRVTEDETILVTKELKRFDVIFDGDEEHIQQITYGDPLPGNYICYENKDGNITLYHPGDTVTTNLNLTSIKLEVEDDYLLINDADDLNEFSSAVNAGCIRINGKLTSDIIASDDYEPIGKRLSNGSSMPYRGTLDGQGHSVTLNMNASDRKYVGFIGVAGGGDAVIKNVVTKGEVHGNYATGGIAGASAGGGIVRIENCINEAKVIGEDTDVAGIIGTNIDGDSTIYITNCANLGEIQGKEYTSAMCGWAGGSACITNCYNAGTITNTKDGVTPNYSFIRGSWPKIQNCYQVTANVNQTLTGLTTITNKQLESGEIAWKLNGATNDATPVWYQTCGTGVPVLKGDAATQTVYYAYVDCSSQNMDYTNQKHLQEGHGFLYSSLETVITAQCEFCAEAETANIILEDTTFNGSAHGAEIQYGTNWDSFGLAELTLKYATSQDETYETTVPVAAGDWYVKAYIGETENAIGDAVSYTIEPASQEKPSGLITVDETYANENDGEIKNLTTAMEYRYQVSGEEAWTAWEKVTDAKLSQGTMSNLSDGIYEVRYAAKDNYQASEVVSLTIAAGVTRTYEVIVTNGTGDGTFEKNVMVYITADPAGEGKQFANWSFVTGSVVSFADKNSPSTSFVMPAGSVEVQANYESIPTPTPEAPPTPTPEATPTPTPEVTPTPTPEATPAPTPEATPTPTPEATPAPTPEVTPAPTPEVTQAPTSTPTSIPILTPTITPAPTRIPGPIPGNEGINVGSSILNATKLEDGTYVDEKGNPIVSSIVKTKWNHELILDENGKIMKNTIAVMPNGKTYYSGKWGYILKNKTFVYKNATYFSQADGTIVTDELVMTSFNHLCYASSTGEIVKSQIIILEDGTRYFASKTGAIYRNKFIKVASGNKYYATPSGQIAVSTMITRSNGDQYYATASGLLARDKWITYEGEKYYCDKTGKVIKKK